MTAVLVAVIAPAVASTCVQALADAGYEARAATSVDAALVELVDARPDAVVLDYSLDRDSSLLRLLLVRQRLPVLVVSGLEDEDAARTAAAAHGWSSLALAKPFDEEALQNAVALLLPTANPEPAVPPDRTTLVPDLPPAPIAPRAEAFPPPPPSAQFTPSGRPPPPVVVQAIDRFGDIVACLVIGHLCTLDKVSGEVAVLAIGGIVGVGTGLRQAGASAGVVPGVGVVGLLLLGLGRWLAPAAGAAELARASGLFGLLAVLVLGAGCPKLPPVSGCEPLSQRCEGDRPQVCSSSRRWHFVGDERCDASPGQRCEVRNAVAGCAR